MPLRIHQIQTDLAAALQELNAALIQDGIKIHLRVIGAFALQLLGVASTYTIDIDVIDQIDDSVRKTIAKVGKAHRLTEDWINDVASDLDLPLGFEQRMETIELHPAIKVSYPSRQDIISLKSRAFLHRGAKNPAEAQGVSDLKDLEDITKLAPTKIEIDVAIEFVRKTSSPPEPQFFPDFEEYIEVLRRVAR